MKRTFELIILGSNSAIPNINRFSTAQIVNLNFNLFLIDAAEGVQIQINRFNLKPSKIENIFISHLHGDHYFGLFGLLSTFNLQHRLKPLNIFAPKNLTKILDVIFPEIQDFTYKINFFPLEDGVNKIFENKDIEIFSFPLKHSIPTWGFIFQEKPLPPNIIKEKIKQFNLTIEQIKALKEGKDIYINGKLFKNQEFTIAPPKPRKYVFMSDTAYLPEAVPIIKNADVLYHEATFTEKNSDLAVQTLHSTAKQAAQIAKLSNSQKLILGHFSQRDPINQFLTEAKEIFPNVILAYDGLTIEI